MLVHLLILNYNGRSLLTECLPSVLRAAGASRHRCDVVVIDNDSSDDSVDWLAEHHPEVRVIRKPNRGLSSYNEVVATLPGRIAVLLNNDVKLDEECLDPLVEPLLAEQSDCFMTAPSCRRFDGTSYEGFRTAVLWRWGLIQATALFPGHEPGIDQPGPTASAGAVMAVDRRKFVELGGFDPLYLPGRLEDLDFAFRAFLEGYYACYVPEARSWHQGMATFSERFGTVGCDRLALRNTLLFEWKNLRHPLYMGRALLGLAARWALDVAFMPWMPAKRRGTFGGALAAAWRQYRKHRAADRDGSSTKAFARPRGKLRREREFFRRFSPARMAVVPPSLEPHPTMAAGKDAAAARESGGAGVASGPKYLARSREVCQSQ
ncbi:MAG: glycosyltransferase [Pirellulales bacterium]|nr:glycosyltransferase [Pirellulales bacterium]